jgi:hypothetical protein
VTTSLRKRCGEGASMLRVVEKDRRGQSVKV